MLFLMSVVKRVNEDFGFVEEFVGICVMKLEKKSN